MASVPQREQLARTSESPLPKEKGTAGVVSPEHQIVSGERVKVSKSRTLARYKGGGGGRDQSGSMERKEWNPHRRKVGYKEVREGKQGEPP